MMVIMVNIHITIKTSMTFKTDLGDEILHIKIVHEML